MDFESILSNYRMLPLVKRFLIAAFLGTIPAILLLLEDAVQINQDLDDARASKESAKAKFDKAKDQAANLPKLEEKLALTETQLLDASKKLPDEFVMDKVLQKTAMIAQDIGIALRVFDPGDGIPSETAFRYMELPIRVELLGTYGQIAAFFDRVVHLELLVHIKNVDLALSSIEAEDAKIKGARTKDDKADEEAKESKLTPEQSQRKSRANARILATADMVIFRTLSETESQAISSAINGKKNS